MLKYSSLAIQAARLCGCLAQRGMELPGSMKFMLVFVYFSMPLCKTETVVTSCETENILVYIIEFVLIYVYKQVFMFYVSLYLYKIYILFIINDSEVLGKITVGLDYFPPEQWFCNLFVGPSFPDFPIFAVTQPIIVQSLYAFTLLR